MGRAIALYRWALVVEPRNADLHAKLARLLAANHQREEARLLLDGLADRCRGRDLRRVRGVEMRISPGPASLWRWIRAVAEPDSAEARPRSWSLLRSRSAGP